MDPNATLQELRELYTQLQAIYARPAGNDGTTYTPAQDAEMVAHGERIGELLQALDQWITRDGCLPDAWRRAQAAPRPTTVWIVYEEWAHPLDGDAAEIVSVHTTEAAANQAAQAQRKYWAEEFEYPKIVWCYPTDEDQDPDWDVDIHVDQLPVQIP